VPRLTVRGEGGEIVYDGPGELVIRDDPMAPGQVRISIHQEEVRATGVRGRELDITEFLREAPASHAAEYDVPEVAAFDLDGPALPVPFPDPPRVSRWVLDIAYPVGALAWLGETLRQSFETPDERRARLEARHESFRRAMRTARQGAFGTTALMSVMQPDLVCAAALLEDLRAQAEAVSGQRITLSDLLAGGAVPRETEGGHEVAVSDYEATVQFSAADVRSSMARLRDQYVNRDRSLYESRPALTQEEIQRVYDEAVVPREQFLHDFWGTEPSPFDPSRIGAAGDFGGTFPDVLERILARSAEHEEAITSARSEFPYDPLDYGRIYPGDTGTSRWTPPEDPDEKIRSCP
jgi:hypothetical protein